MTELNTTLPSYLFQEIEGLREALRARNAEIVRLRAEIFELKQGLFNRDEKDLWRQCALPSGFSTNGET